MITPLPHQLSGADHLASHSHAGLFDEMGLGKTGTAIIALDKQGVRRCVVICPAAAREVWVGEFKKFGKIPRKVIKAKSHHDLGLWLKGRADVLIVSYEYAVKWTKWLEGDLIPAIIFDEAHYLKTADSIRTKVMLSNNCDGIYGLARWGMRVWFLTGTPIPNDPIDIWPFLRFVGATTLSKGVFGVRYFKQKVGAFSVQHTPRDNTLGELRSSILNFAIARTLDSAGVKLPPVFLTDVTIDGDRREIHTLLRQWPGLEADILRAIDEGSIGRLEMLAPHIATLRRLVGEAKAPAYTELLHEELKNGAHKVVVFGVHRRAMDHIETGLRAKNHKVVRFDGETSERARMEAVHAFQNGDAQVFLGQVRAAGTALTLTAAHHIDMFESSWAPADNAQALKRVHRIGQDQSVSARFITLAGSIDETVSAAVARKTASIAKLAIGG